MGRTQPVCGIGWTNRNDNKPRSSQDSRKRKSYNPGEIRNGKKVCYSNFIMQQGGTSVLFWNQAIRKFRVIREIGVWCFFSTAFLIAYQCRQAYLSFRFEKRWNKSHHNFYGDYFQARVPSFPQPIRPSFAIFFEKTRTSDRHPNS